MIRRNASALGRLLDHDYAAATTLSLGAIVGLVWSSISESSYSHAVAAWPASLNGLDIHTWRDFVGNGLMTIFFFGIGLEVARERHHGALHDLRHALAPVLAAVGGMTGPALIVVIVGLVTGTNPLVHGWGIPMATDIAFTLAILSLAGKDTARGLRPFLLTLAITDDVLSVVVLSGTGVSNLDLVALVGALVLAGIAALAARWLRHVPGRLIVVAILWLLLARSGVEPPLAGVIGALVIPFEARRSIRLERDVTRLSVGLVLPLFAASFCGVLWSGLSTKTAGIIVGAMVVARIAGKSLGIVAGTSLARLAGAFVPHAVSGRRLAGASVLCAIGLTVPLLFAGRLYEPSGATYAAFNVGLIGGSIVAGVVGVLLLRSAQPATPEGDG